MTRIEGCMSSEDVQNRGKFYLKFVICLYHGKSDRATQAELGGPFFVEEEKDGIFRMVGD